MKNKTKAAIFIMPRTSSDWQSAEGLWVTARGWAKAASKYVDKIYFVTRDKITDLEGSKKYPIRTGKNKPSKVSAKLKWVPAFPKIFIKDLKLRRNSKQWSILDNPPWKEDDVRFVWEQHDIFPGPGAGLAKALGADLVTFVHAPQVWEAEIWGVRRYLWGKLIQKKEIQNINKSNLVATVSENVSSELRKMGAKEELLAVTPMSVDPDLFNTSANALSRSDFGLEDTLTVGWVGSFRDFHGVDHVVKAFELVRRQNPKAKLVFIGDGQVCADTKELAKTLEIADDVLFLGQKPNAEIPKYLSLFDVAVVSARSSDDFHYSPHKLREYMAVGIASIAPKAGEVLEIFEDGENILLYQAGDIHELYEKMNSLLENSALRESIGNEGREFVHREFTWDAQFERVKPKLKSLQ